MKGKRGVRIVSSDKPGTVPDDSVDSGAVTGQGPAKKPRYSTQPDGGSGGKGRRSCGSASNDYAKLHERIIELVSIRETGPERVLAEHISAATAEATARDEVCAFYKSEIARLESLLKDARVGAGVNEELRKERLRADDLEMQVMLLLEEAATRGAGGPSDKEAARSDATEAPTAAQETTPASLSAAASGVDPAKVDKVNSESQVTAPEPALVAAEPAADATQPSHSDSNLMLEYLRRFTGISAMQRRLPDKKGFELTIRNPNDERRVNFRLVDEGDGELSYEPIEVLLPSAPSSAFFRDDLDFTWESAPVLHRELLAYVYEKGNKNVMSTASKKRI
jgi:hypothetical protein